MTDYHAAALRDAKYSIMHHISVYDLHEDDWPTPKPTPAQVRAHLIGELYYAVRDVFTPPEPAEITQASQVSAWMLAWGAPDTGRDIGRSVQRWRDAARGVGEARLRETLLSIEARMK